LILHTGGGFSLLLIFDKILISLYGIYF